MRYPIVNGRALRMATLGMPRRLAQAPSGELIEAEEALRRLRANEVNLTEILGPEKVAEATRKAEERVALARTT